jgi:serine/threonine-protein kinase ATR
LSKFLDTWESYSLPDRPDLVKKKIMLFHEMKKRFPPVLGRWYMENFSTPINFFHARQNYIKSSAIIDMIGYILGLGDRHMENITFDTITGEIVHVDFNCVFSKGENLKVPETVPFRLTQSMVDAMGPLKIEGVFRKCCEISLGLMQKEINTLMAYFLPFVNDPLNKTDFKTTEQERKRVDDKITIVEEKLKGIVQKYQGSSEAPLSCVGQVHYVIEEATSDKNLSRMYFFWSPFI